MIRMFDSLFCLMPGGENKLPKKRPLAEAFGEAIAEGV